MAKALSDKGFDAARYHPCNCDTLCQICKDDRPAGIRPYDNLEKRAYPAMLVTTSFNDSQVMYWEPAKYVARLRTVKTDGNPLLLKIKMDPAGHGGASGRYDRLKDQAFEYAWLLSQVGITK